MANEVEDLYLQPWQEVAGTCVKIAISETGTAIVLQTNSKKYRLLLPHTRCKPEELRRKLIAVLKTESLDRPFLIRKMDVMTKTAEQKMAHFMLKTIRNKAFEYS